MFISREEVLALTGYNVSLEEIAYAQTIIEVHVGRTEADVEDLRDLALLGRAVAFQAVYMQEHSRMVYEQVDVQSLSVGGAAYEFGNNPDSPYIAPMAVKACAKLSWTRSRGVKTGRIGPPTRLANWWTN